ncbi:MAG: hypothetical protein JSV31_08670 [Desulfobacterales bacterium]|jgi:hypothetical protein|nr:MAG: hypothetical protein JSV31_08670 [Desulfobacterales bacterium]
MRKKELLVVEEADLEIEPQVTVDEKNLVVFEERPKKKIDETISSPDKYVSRYHYKTKDLDATLELCPHCKKPTFSAFRRVVADNALNYLIEKEDQKNRRSNRRRNLVLITGAIVFLAGLYYWIFHVISGARI